MMIIWVAVGVFLLSDGPQIADPAVFKTEAECCAVLAKVAEKADAHEDMLAYGHDCVKLTINDVKHDPAKPVARQDEQAAARCRA
jgi:hypothetical protein